VLGVINNIPRTLKLNFYMIFIGLICLYSAYSDYKNRTTDGITIFSLWAEITESRYPEYFYMLIFIQFAIGTSLLLKGLGIVGSP